MKTVNLKEGMPQVCEAISQLSRELAVAKQQGYRLIKLIHGYGSTGAGGEIRIAVQEQLRAMSDRGEIRGCIFGEKWAKSDERTWRIINAYPVLKQDRDLGRGNRGITIVLL
jgi:fermentation-respiration switch protein FrsA (DUF1100 family)